MLTINMYSQISVNNDNSDPDASAMFEVKSTDKGILIPRMTTAQRNLIGSPALGLLVFDTDTESFWFKESGGWVELGGTNISDRIEDFDSETKVQVEETFDENKIRFDLDGIEYFVMDRGRIHVRNTGESVFLGDSAGINDDFTTNRNVFIGTKSGFLNTDGRNNVGVGAYSLGANQSGEENTAIGGQALNHNIAGNANTVLGYNSLGLNTYGRYNIAVGHSALSQNTYGDFNTSMGYQAGRGNQNGNNNVFIGGYSGSSPLSTWSQDFSVMIGYEAGKESSSSGSIFLGYRAGKNKSTDNRLYIENSDADFTNALLYGEFDNDFLRLNANTLIRDTLILPTGATDGYFLRSDANGKASWAPVMGVDMIQDADNDTKIQLEESADEDKIRFDLGGTEYFVMENGRIHVKNTGRSIFLGDSAGLNASFSDQRNIFIGSLAGYQNTFGIRNVALGDQALRENTNGVFNTAAGSEALRYNTTGTGNTAFGYKALFNNTGGVFNIAVGATSLYQLTNGGANIALGSNAGYNTSSGNSNIFIGDYSGRGDSLQTRHNNIMLGYQSGYHNSGSNNVFVGSYSGYNESGNQRLYIENSNADSANALIYGQFDNDFLRFNANTLVRDTLILPTGATNGYVLTSDPDGKASWAPAAGGSSDKIQDADNDTKIQVEESADEDKIRFDIGGTEHFVMDSAGRFSILNTTGTVSIGEQAGIATTSGPATNNVFIGKQAGQNSNLFTKRNIFIGELAGQNIIKSAGNIGIGSYALLNDSSGNSNIALGTSTLVENKTGSNNIGQGTFALYHNQHGDYNLGLGTYSLFWNHSGEANVGLGYGTGNYNENGSENVLIGKFAGHGNNPHDKSQNVMIGNQSGYNSEGDGNVFLGNFSGYNEPGNNRLYITNANTDSVNSLIYGQFDNSFLRLNANTLVRDTLILDNGRIQINNTGGSVFLGDSSGISDDLSDNRNTFIGFKAGKENISGEKNTSIGNSAGYHMTSGDDNVLVGYNSGYGSASHTKNRNVMLGVGAGRFNEGSENIFLGFQAGRSESGSNRLYIENSTADSANALIYGQFDNDFLRLNANTLIRDTLILPTGATNGYVLTSDANGKASWAPTSVDSPDMILDADNDTRIQVEESADEDKIRFDLGGTEYFVMDQGRIHVKNTGSSVFLGDSAGINDDLTNNQNVFIGSEAGKFTTSGDNNNAIGAHALYNNQNGRNNNAIGKEALSDNQNGNNNIAVGSNSLSSNIDGSNNIAQGPNSMYRNTTGNNNISIGTNALYRNQEGSGNVILGNLAGTGDSLHNKNGNVMIGYTAGYHNEGDKNIFLGYESGFNESGSHRLYIENSNKGFTNALIYGEFDNDYLRLNANTLIRDTLFLSDGAVMGELFLNGEGDGNNYFPVTIKNNDPGLNFGNRVNGLQIIAGQNSHNADSRMIAFIKPNGTEIGSVRQTASNSITY
ncbi:MAG: hypothetical protein KDD99_15040, partial [Bacteroidetes bacterium]|nr:hypothetical protein [Bacteroidota bacterium]